MWKISKVVFEKSGTRREHFPKEPRLPQVAFVGRSNVGKSSLLNSIVNRKRLAKVSNTPGRTQLVNFFIVDDKVRLVDLPGYGFAQAPQAVKGEWEKMILTYLTDNPQLRGLCALFDIRRTPSSEDIALLNWLQHYQVPFIAVLTKADKLVRSHQALAKQEMVRFLEAYSPREVVLFSATTRQGRHEVLGALGRLLKEDASTEPADSQSPESA